MVIANRIGLRRLVFLSLVKSKTVVVADSAIASAVGAVVSGGYQALLFVTKWARSICGEAH